MIQPRCYVLATEAPLSPEVRALLVCDPEPMPSTRKERCA